MEGTLHRRLLIGVSGGVAAYKSVELVRLLRAAGAEVRVVMTRSAVGFVAPRTFQAVSAGRVWTEWADDRSGMDHIELARWAERILIAPATADTLARLAHGRADDLLAAVCLASSAPLCVAPAMNQGMWRSAATQCNVSLLQERGAQIWGPAWGEQACGETGPGRMLEPAELAERLAATFRQGPLYGVRALVTAGPTREAIDPVRFLSNRSSGKMGYAVAGALRDAGAEVALISGPVALVAPPGVSCVRVESAQEMLEAVLARLESGCDLFIGAAAVADYRPVSAAAEKIKRAAEAVTLHLEPAPDILATVTALKPRPFCVGFAAETANLHDHAQHKRLSKGVDMIVANQVGKGLGMETDDNELLVLWQGGSRLLSRDSKPRVARGLVDCIAEVYSQGTLRRGSPSHHAEHSA